MTQVLRPQCRRKNSRSYACRYCGLSYDCAFEETVSADQDNGAVIYAADNTSTDEEDDPHNVIGTVEIQIELGEHLKFTTDQQKLLEITVIMSHSL